MVVQHNITAMNANRMLGITTNAQSKSSERLSSGYRINRAADDAAGLTISEKMRKQIRGLDQASTNAEDGVSAVQTAEGALTEVHSMLQRMNELAVQAANGTNSESDRSAIQDEIDQLTTEIDRVAETTKFNEIYLLKGDTGTKTVDLEAHDAGLAGTLKANSDGTYTFTADTLNIGDEVTIGGKTYTIGNGSSTTTVSISDDDLADLIASAETKGSTVCLSSTTYTYYAKGQELVEGSGLVLTSGGWNGGDAKTADNLVDSDTVASAASELSEGETVTIDGTVYTKTEDGWGYSTSEDGSITTDEAYKLMAKELLAANSVGDTNGTADIENCEDGTFTITVGSATVANTLSFNLHVGSDADMTNKITVDIETMNADYLGITGLDVSDDTGMGATYAIDAISDALAKVSEQRSALGAIQNRLEHTISNLDNIVENTTSAESRIRDTDMAEEMVEYSKNNILAQAGQSMLAQANTATQGVLSLLQ